MNLSERDATISRLRQQSTDAVSRLEKTHLAELLALKDERDRLQQKISDFRSANNILLIISCPHPLSYMLTRQTATDIIVPIYGEWSRPVSVIFIAMVTCKRLKLRYIQVRKSGV